MYCKPVAWYAVDMEGKEKDPAAVALGKKGGKKRWEGVSPEARSKHGKHMAEVHYGNKKKPIR